VTKIRPGSDLDSVLAGSGPGQNAEAEAVKTVCFRIWCSRHREGVIAVLTTKSLYQ